MGGGVTRKILSHVALGKIHISTNVPETSGIKTVIAQVNISVFGYEWNSFLPHHLCQNTKIIVASCLLAGSRSSFCEACSLTHQQLVRTFDQKKMRKSKEAL